MIKNKYREWNNMTVEQYDGWTITPCILAYLNISLNTKIYRNEYSSPTST